MRLHATARPIRAVAGARTGRPRSRRQGTELCERQSADRLSNYREALLSNASYRPDMPQADTWAPSRRRSDDLETVRPPSVVAGCERLPDDRDPSEVGSRPVQPT